MSAREASAATIRAIIRRRARALSMQLRDLSDDLTITENANTARGCAELDDILSGVAEEVTALIERSNELAAAVEAGR